MSSIFRSFTPVGSQLFIASGSFTVPAGTNRLVVLGAGGGQGGGGGGVTNAGSGGIGVQPWEIVINVSPAQVWVVTLGAGSFGTAGLSSAGPNSLPGGGGNTTFVNGGTTYTFFGSGTTPNVFNPVLITTANNVASLYAPAGAALGGGGGGGGFQAGGFGSQNGSGAIGGTGNLSAGGGGGGQHSGTGSTGGTGGSGFILVTW